MSQYNDDPVPVPDELDEEALDPKWYDEYYEGFDEYKKKKEKKDEYYTYKL